MVTESTLFYLVLLTMLVFILNVVLTRPHRRHDSHT